MTMLTDSEREARVNDDGETLHDAHVKAWLMATRKATRKATAHDDFRRINRVVAQQFLKSLDANDLAQHFFQTYTDRKPKPKPDWLAKTFCGSLRDTVAANLDALQGEGAAVSVTINEVDGAERKASRVVRIRAIPLDLDGAPLTPILEAGLSPHWINRTSPDRYQCFYYVADCAVSDYWRMTLALAEKFGGDVSMAEPARCVRLPGSWHMKGEPHQVTPLTELAAAQGTAPYTCAEIIAKLKLELPPVYEARERGNEAPATDAHIKALLNALVVIDARPRPTWIKVGQALKTLPDDAVGFAIWDGWSKTAPEVYEADDAADKWRGFRGERTHWRAVFAEARRHGWTGSEEGLPRVIVNRAQTHITVDEIAAVLGGSGRYFRREQTLTRIVRLDADEKQQEEVPIQREQGTLFLRRPTSKTVIDDLSRFAEVIHRDARTNAYRRVPCPEHLAAQFIDVGVERPELPPLLDICATPILRDDGTLYLQAGYDPLTRAYVDPGGMKLSEIVVPEHATRDDALAALAVLRELLVDFPWRGRREDGTCGAHEAVVLSGILTALDRPNLDSVPMHGFSSPVWGTGKGLLVTTIGIITTGRGMPLLTQGDSQREFLKRFDSVTMTGDPFMCIDDAEMPIEGSAIKSFLTTGNNRVRIRKLGKNGEDVEVPARTMWFATGNNLTVSLDLVRRVLVAEMDANVSKPYEREDFQIPDLEAHVCEHRMRYLSAAYTILRAYQQADRPQTKRLDVKGLGSYIKWVRRIRHALLWLDVADPVRTQDEVATNDDKIQLRVAIFSAIYRVVGSEPFTAGGIVEKAEAYYDGNPNEAVRELRVAIAAFKERSVHDVQKLGMWLLKAKNQIAGGLKLIRREVKSASASYCLEVREEAELRDPMTEDELSTVQDDAPSF